MTNKAPDEKPKFVVKKREKKAKPNFFENVTPFKHPVSDLLQLNEPDNFLDTQKENPVHSELNFLDTQNNISGHSENKSLDTQTIKPDAPKETLFGHSENKPLDTQNNNSGHSEELFLDTQPEKSGHPITENLSANAPENKIEAPKNEKTLSANTPKEKILGTQKKYDYKKYDAKRSTVRVNLHLDRELDQNVREFCVLSNPRLELKEFFELAARHFLDTQKKLGLSANAPVNNLINSLSRTKPSIINIYLAYNSIFNTETKWKTSDDKVGEIFNNADIRLVEIGIIQTQGELYQQLENGKYAKKDPSKIINAFSYYRQKIESNIEFFEGNEQMIAYLLESSRAKHKKWTGKDIDLNFLQNEN